MSKILEKTIGVFQGAHQPIVDKIIAEGRIPGIDENTKKCIEAFATRIKNDVHNALEKFKEHIEQQRENDRIRHEEEMKRLSEKNRKLFWGTILTWVLFASSILTKHFSSFF